MRKAFLFALLILACAPLAARAQNGTEVFGGYSYNRIDNGGGTESHRNGNGFDAEVTKYFKGDLGVTGDVSGHYNTSNFTGRLCPPGFGCTQVISNYRVKEQLYNFLGGLQYKLRGGDNRVQPFAHALFGLAHTRLRVENFGAFGNPPQNLGGFTVTSNNFAMSLGGGVDVKLSDRVDLRAIQAEYNPVFYRSQDFNIGFGNFKNLNSRADNARISVGVVIKR